MCVSTITLDWPMSKFSRTSANNRLWLFSAVPSSGSKSWGIRVEEVLTDNGSCYVSHAFQGLCHQLGLRHLRTRPYRPQTNGKAERLIQTLLREWAYRFPYRTSGHTYSLASPLASLL